MELGGALSEARPFSSRWRSKATALPAALTEHRQRAGRVWHRSRVRYQMGYGRESLGKLLRKPMVADA